MDLRSIYERMELQTDTKTIRLWNHQLANQNQENMSSKTATFPPPLVLAVIQLKDLE